MVLRQLSCDYQIDSSPASRSPVPELSVKEETLLPIGKGFCCVLMVLSDEKKVSSTEINIKNSRLESETIV